MLNWFKNNKLPITQEDKSWVDDNIEWLIDSFGFQIHKGLETIKPSPKYFDYRFTGEQKDAEFILQKVKKWMLVKNEDITLEYIADGSMDAMDGTMLANPAEGISNSWSGAAGTYRKKEGKTIISIDIRTLKNPEALISTMAHELSHELLLGEQRIEENDEYLTDLTAVFFGLGIFIGNSKFRFKGYSSSDGSGWEMSSQGYLPEQIIAYTMAKLSLERGENIDYNIFLCDSMKKYFKRSLNYLKKVSTKH